MLKTAALALAATLLFACTPSDGDPPDASDDRRDPVEESDRLPCGNIDAEIQRARRGYVPVRSPEISLLPREPNYIGSAARPVHTGPWDYLAEVPLVFFGPGQIEERGRIDDPATMADVAPTIAALIGSPFKAPDGQALDVSVATGDAPRLVVTVVWDGGGYNALRAHPDKWPFLEKLMDRGTSFRKMEIGSTPSNTPPVHTTLGTGAFPRHHGIPAVKMEIESGAYIDPYEGNNADRVRLPTLADVYDKDNANGPKIAVVATVNWHLGMIGHGAHFPGGDRDIALLMNDQGEGYGDTTAYDIPQPSGSLTGRADDLDGRDGARDGRWLGNDLTDPAVRYSSPAYVAHQAGVIGSLIEQEGFGDDRIPDLLFTNFKSVDDSGHRWGMTSRETGEILSAADDALHYLVDGLDRWVGRGEWVVIITADHGQTTYPEESGAWPIGGAELKRDANEALAKGGEEIVTRVTSAGAFVERAAVRSAGRTMAEVARWLVGYTAEENVKAGEKLPAAWTDRAEEPLMDGAVLGYGRAVVGCAR